MVDFTGNTLKSTSTQAVRYIFADDVCTNLEQISAKEAMDIDFNKNIPKQLTPVTIMVVDTIFSVKSRIISWPNNMKTFSAQNHPCTYPLDCQHARSWLLALHLK